MKTPHPALAGDVPVLGTVMHRPVLCVAAEDTLWDAMDLMLRSGLRHLVVVHGDTAFGVLMDREMAAVWAMNPLGLKHTTVGELVSSHEQFLDPDTDVLAVARRMCASGVDAVVAVDGERRPLGIVTGHDLLGVLADLLAAASGAKPFHGADKSRLAPD